MSHTPATLSFTSQHPYIPTSQPFDMLIDISPIVDASIHGWPGDTPVVQTINADMKSGDNLTLSDIRTSVHVGAHADAPMHYSSKGADIASRRLDFYLGRCVVIHVDVARSQRITSE